MKLLYLCFLSLSLLFSTKGLKLQSTNQGRKQTTPTTSPCEHQPTTDSIKTVMDRRTALVHSLSTTAAAALSTLLLLPTQVANAAPATATTDSSTTTTTSNAKVTDVVSMDVRISRQDGTFYVRDDLPDTPENQVTFATLRFGLFGNDAPKAVAQFLRYVDVKYDALDDDPPPSYGRSTFPALDETTGLLMGGYIPSLRLKDFGGSTNIQYGNRILPAPFWGSSAFRHEQAGLLTHRQLDLTPSFGITTRPAPFELDGSHVIFGVVLLDDSSRKFFEVVESLPTYKMDRPGAVGREDTAMETVAAGVFNAQRDFFRSAASSFGDTRVGKVYEGKLLRRVEVVKVARAK